jgi:hypothetical protein
VPVVVQPLTQQVLEDVVVMEPMVVVEEVVVPVETQLRDVVVMVVTD